jgi:hypothetical protein
LKHRSKQRSCARRNPNQGPTLPRDSSLNPAADQTPLNDPLFQSLVTDQWLQETISNGIPGTLMPPHSVDNGGWITDSQIEEIVSGMRTAWRGTPPAYAASSPAIINWKPR